MRPQCLLLACLCLACPSTDPGDDAASSAGDTDEPPTGTGGEPTGGEPPPVGGLYTSAILKVVLEVDYAPGAEPYTGSVVGIGDVWDVFATNAEALLGGGKALEIPRTLEQMQALPDVTGDSFDGPAIAAIAAAHRDVAAGADTASFYALWLPGYYDDGEAVRMDVLGVSFGDTGVIAMFKPVIEDAGVLTLGAEKLVEQVTLVHEFGHAAGLVNNGLSLTGPHQDEAHGRHCSNQDCVMFWTVESSDDVVAFVTANLTDGATILWGDECLADAQAALAAGG